MKFSPLRKAGWAFFALSFFALLSLTGPAAAEQPTFDLGKYHGKVVYLDFWASWCGPCKLSFPFMEELHYRYLPKDMVVITVNLDHSHSAAASFLKKMRSNLSVIYDAKGDLAKSYRVSDMPTSILFDRQGKVRFVHKGFYPDKKGEYMSQIAQLIHEN